MEATVTCPSCGKSVPLKKFCIYCEANLECVKVEMPKKPISEQVVAPEAEAAKPKAVAS